MLTVSPSRVICIDVDDTLVFLEPQARAKRLAVEFNQETLVVYINQRVVNKLIAYKQQGFYIIVWSQEGADWVSAVVQALNLSAYVDLALTKPEICIDDLPSSAWIKVIRP